MNIITHWVPLPTPPDAERKHPIKPIEHGRWYKCSVCGYWWRSDCDDEIINDFNYCPNCGEKMNDTEDFCLSKQTMKKENEE